MTRRLIVLFLLSLVLVGCDYASDPVRLGKQSVSEANAYKIESKADQDAADQAQMRATRERQDAITVREQDIRAATTTEQFKRLMPALVTSAIIAAVGVGISIAIVSLGASSATAISQNARAIKELRQAATFLPDQRGIQPSFMLPANAKVKIVDPSTGGVLLTDKERRISRPQLEAKNELNIKASIANQQVTVGSEQPIVMAEPRPVQVQRARLTAKKEENVHS
jgi:hypothetical protein